MTTRFMKSIEGFSPSITGTVLFRDASPGIKVPKGKKAMMVAGVILVDVKMPIPPETLASVAGFIEHDAEVVLSFHQKASKPLDTNYSGWSIEQLLKQPIWRA